MIWEPVEDVLPHPARLLRGVSNPTGFMQVDGRSHRPTTNGRIRHCRRVSAPSAPTSPRNPSITRPTASGPALVRMCLRATPPARIYRIDGCRCISVSLLRDTGVTEALSNA